jgi:ATP-binding cassette subfamily F protein uup
MRRERGERREVMGSAKMQVEEAARSGKIVFEMENVNYQVDGKVLVRISAPRSSAVTKLP